MDLINSKETKNNSNSPTETSSILLLTIALIFTSTVFVWFVKDIHPSQHEKAEINRKNLRISELKEKINYLGDYLALSAKMAAATGDLEWETKYRAAEAEFRQSIRETKNFISDPNYLGYFNQIDRANERLAALNNRGFDLIREGESDAARQILFSDEYDAQKKISAGAIENISKKLEEIQTVSSAEHYNFGLIVLSGALLALTILVWLANIRRIFSSEKNLSNLIAAQEQTAQIPQESEKRFRELFENANDIIFTIDLQGNFTSFNKVVETVTGYRRDELFGANFSQIVAPEKLEVIKEMISEKIKSNGATKYETEIISKEGDRISLEINSRLILENGKPIGIQGIARDISDSKQAAKNKLKADQYENLFSHANDAILIFEPENEIVLEVNARACELYGRTREEFIGQSLKDMSENVERGTEELEKLLQAGNYEEFESVHYRKDGTPFDLIINASVIEYQGKLAIMTINRDVTARKQLAEDLGEREKHLLSVTNSVRDAIVTADNNGKIIFWNEAARKLYGYEEQEIIGQPLSVLLPEKHRESYIEVLKRYLEYGEKEIVERVIEVIGIKKDGSKFPVELSMGVWETARGNYFTGIIRDITERRKLEQIQILRAHEVGLRAEIGSTFAGSDEPLQANLTRCAEAIVKHLDAAFARIWTFNEAESVLELQASAGIYTHLDGAHARVPIGAFKIGRIAQKRLPHITNDVMNDPQVGDKEWARQMNMKAFAGCPLLVDGRLLGVMAMFAQHELAEETINTFSGVADIIAQSIERRRAIEALEKSEGQYRLLGEGIMHQVWTTLPDGTFDYVNRRAFEYFGNSGGKNFKENLKNWIHPEDFPRVIKCWRESVKTGKPFEAEVRLKRADGAYLWHVSRASAGRDHDGKIIKWFGTSTDIHDQKIAEGILRESEERFRMLVEGVEDYAIFMLDPNGYIVSWNMGAERVKKYKADEIIGNHFSIFYTQKDRDINHPEEELRIATAEGRFEEEGWRVRKDGTQFLANVLITAIKDSQGNLQGFSKITRDITERKMAEQKLRESQEIFRSFMDNNPAIAFMKDEDGRYVFCNKTMGEIFDNDVENLIGKTDFEWMEKPVALTLAENDAKVFSSNRIYQMVENVPLASGEVRRWLTVKFPISDASGKKFIGGVSVDVTERERAENALRESEYRLRTLLTNMSEGLLQVDNQEIIEYVNERFCEMTGYTENELLGKNTFNLLFDDDGRKIINQINHQRQQGVSGQYEMRLKKKSGEIIYVIVGGTPIINAAGKVTGSMGIYTDITERKRAEDQLLHDAFHDGLTGLANRTLFMDHLRMAIKRNERNHGLFAVLFLDFDRFKVINDSLGHSEGDKFLKQVARRLEAVLRPGDLVARLGGDEFTILLNEFEDESEAVRIAERIQEDLKKSFTLGGREIFISASIGITLSSSGHTNAEDMLRDADIAMYRAKTRGRAQHQIFDRQMHEQASKQLQLETEMRRAVEREEFLIHYQPIMNLETEKLVGFEALVRWKHETHGLIPPIDFIPAAEESGLILPLGQWILRESCRQLREWQDKYPTASNLTISVNLSSKQFSQFDLAEQVAATLKETNLDPRCLKLEITESHLMDSSEEAINILNRLRALRVELSLDDFGTGYSSLSYLHRLPVTYLKVDRSFVTQMLENQENDEIVSTIIKLAQNLRMKIVAEGIENAEQLAHLRNLNCEYGQGFYFSKPLETTAAEKFIEHNTEDFSFAANQPEFKLGMNL